MAILYRLGWPFGRMAARIGFPVAIAVDIVRDDEAGVFIGTSPDVPGLIVEAETLETLLSEAENLIPALLVGCNNTLPRRSYARMRYNATLPAAVA